MEYFFPCYLFDLCNIQIRKYWIKNFRTDIRLCNDNLRAVQLVVGHAFLGDALMRFKILSLLAALVLVAACETAPEETADSSGNGSTSTASSNTGSSNTDASNSGSAIDEVAAGSERDFLVNVGDRVHFDYDRSDLSSDSQAVLAKQAAWLLQFPQVVIQVEGHCDERGTREYNLALGERRANSVKEYLMSLGVAADRVSTISYGKERPAVEGTNKEAFAQNRRGVTRLVGGTNS